MFSLILPVSQITKKNKQLRGLRRSTIKSIYFDSSAALDAITVNLRRSTGTIISANPRKVINGKNLVILLVCKVHDMTGRYPLTENLFFDFTANAAAKHIFFDKQEAVRIL